MTIVADHVYSRPEELAGGTVAEVLPHDQTKSRFNASGTRFHWKAWAIAGTAAIALIATLSIRVFNNTGRLDEQQARTMGLVTSQTPAVPQRDAPASRQLSPQDLRETALSSLAANQNGPVVANHSTSAANPQVPMIARTASLTILVKDFSAARASLGAILARYGGYSANLIIDTPENGQRHFQASLRIPANQLDSALTDLKKLGGTLNEAQTGEEVTQQHADLLARLQNSRETEQRMRAILEQRTGKIDDVLQVEEQIARVRGEIESMESEQKTLEHRVTFAGVDLQLVEEYKEQFNSSPVSGWGRIRNGFVEGMLNASGTLLGLIVFLEEFGPAILIWVAVLGLPAFLVWRRYRSAHARL